MLFQKNGSKQTDFPCGMLVLSVEPFFNARVHGLAEVHPCEAIFCTCCEDELSPQMPCTAIAPAKVMAIKITIPCTAFAHGLDLAAAPNPKNKPARIRTIQNQ